MPCGSKERSKAGDSRAKLIKVQQHFCPRTLALLINKGGKEGLCLESDQKAHCYCNILSAEYDETLQKQLYKHSRIDHLSQQEDVWDFCVILADVSALLAPNLNCEERCADQALITHYLERCADQALITHYLMPSSTTFDWDL